MIADLAPLIFAALVLLLVGFWFSPYDLEMEDRDDEEVLSL